LQTNVSSFSLFGIQMLFPFLVSFLVAAFLEKQM